MEMNQIEAFVMIAQVQGFSRAASMLHLSQPAISRRISLLEDELGVTLFERVHGGALLTEAGQTFLPFARQILAGARDGIEAVKAVERQELGSINLALVGTLASTGLTARLLEFRRIYPQVRLKMRTARSNEVSAMVQYGEANLGLRYFAGPHQEIGSRLVDEESLVVVHSTHHNFPQGPPSKPLELSGVPWIGFPTGEGSSGEPFARILTQQLARAGLTTPEIITIDSLTAQKRLIEADFGFGLLPESSVQEELRSGTLSIVKIPELETTVPIMVLYRKQGYLSKAARSLLELLIK
jgi:DNA-binding transcriptional LysR family regulator